MCILLFLKLSCDGITFFALFAQELYATPRDMLRFHASGGLASYADDASGVF